MGVAGGEVVPALLGPDLDRGQGGQAVDDREGQLGAEHPLLQQDGVVVAEGGHEGGRELIGALDQADAQGRAAAVGLDHDREAEFVHRPVEQAAEPQLSQGALGQGDGGRDREAGPAEDGLGGQLVEGEPAGVELDPV